MMDEVRDLFNTLWDRILGVVDAVEEIESKVGVEREPRTEN